MSEGSKYNFNAVWSAAALILDNAIISTADLAGNARLWEREMALEIINSLWSFISLKLLPAAELNQGQ